jgi:mono/diheme cytochrome c family protein
MNRALLQAFAAGTAAAAVVAWGAVLIAGRQASDVSVFTAQQATAGKAAYAKNCASCHLPDLSGNNEIPPLAGKIFMGTWGTRSTKDLFDYMSAAMPYGGPSLSTETYTFIAAYILQSNGATAGTEALTTKTAVPIASVMAAHSTPPTVPMLTDLATTADGAGAVDGDGQDETAASRSREH